MELDKVSDKIFYALDSAYEFTASTWKTLQKNERFCWICLTVCYILCYTSAVTVGSPVGFLILLWFIGLVVWHQLWKAWTDD